MQKLPTVEDLTHEGMTAQFIHYIPYEMWYEINNFAFPISIGERGVFHAQEQAIHMKKYIGNYLSVLQLDDVLAQI